MLVQDTPTSACHTGYTSTDTGLQAEYLARKSAFELRDKQKNARLALVNVPEVVNAAREASDKQGNDDLLATLPRFFDDDEVCSSCLSRGLYVTDDGELAVCLCMSFDPWASTWIEDVLNRLVVQAQRVA